MAKVLVLKSWGGVELPGEVVHMAYPDDLLASGHVELVLDVPFNVAEEVLAEVEGAESKKTKKVEVPVPVEAVVAPVTAPAPIEAVVEPAPATIPTTETVPSAPVEGEKKDEATPAA